MSSYNSDEEILKAMSEIHLKGDWYESDITYSKGIFYKNLEKPKYKSDLIPLDEDVILSDCRNLDYMQDKRIKSIVFDPPFLFRNRQADNNDKICARFSYFKSYGDLINLYSDALRCISSKLIKNGYLFFKCQDMTDGKFYCTHNEIINISQNYGFELKDIFIKISKNKLQADAKQQNCGAKVHSYWLVLKQKG